MPRPRRPEEHENHERWLVSYADFITLLFAFFVVMYATSSVNEGKYRVLSDSMLAAFEGPVRSLDPLQTGQMVRSPISEGHFTPAEMEAPKPEEIELPLLEPKAEPEEAPPDLQGENTPIAELNMMAGKMESSLMPQIEDDMVDVRRKEDWIEVEIKSNILFASGSARLTGEAIPVMRKIAGILQGFPNPVQVEGYTDNVPIHTVAYPSNWELSAARAASVVHLFMKNGVRADRMVAIGYGEHRPIADNETPEGRNKNRRVVIIIPALPETRQQVDLHRMIEKRQSVESPAVEAPPAVTLPSPVNPMALPGAMELSP